jgi:hypothetical protein
LQSSTDISPRGRGVDFLGLGPHSFRRANITWRQKEGASSIEASKIAGHSTVRMTEEYTKIQLRRQEELTRRISGAARQRGPEAGSGGAVIRNPNFSSDALCWVDTRRPMPSFSQRYGFAQPPEVTVREELPSSLRGPIVEIASIWTGATRLRKIVESVLDPYGANPLPLSPAAGMAALLTKAPTDLIAVRERIMACPWYRVYDIVEAFHRELVRQDKQVGVPFEGAPHAPRAAQPVKSSANLEILRSSCWHSDQDTSYFRNTPTRQSRGGISARPDRLASSVTGILPYARRALHNCGSCIINDENRAIPRS